MSSHGHLTRWVKLRKQLLEGEDPMDLEQRSLIKGFSVILCILNVELEVDLGIEIEVLVGTPSAIQPFPVGLSWKEKSL